MRRLLPSLALCVASCTTNYVPPRDAVAVPKSRLYAYQEPLQPPAAMITVTRDTAFGAGACYAALWIDGRLAARFDPGERASFHVRPGERIIRAGPDPYAQGLCQLGQNDAFATTRETVMRPGETKTFRMLGTGGAVDVQRVE